MKLEQTQIVKLTLELELKTKEHLNLCKKLDEFKNQKIDKNSEEYKTFLKEFQNNREQIIKINRKLKYLNELQVDENLEK